MHRAMATAPRSPWLVLQLVLVPAAITVATAKLMPSLTTFWTVALQRLHALLALPGTVVTETRTPGGVLDVSVPYVTAVAQAPGADESWIVGAACVAALAISFCLSLDLASQSRPQPWPPEENS